MSTRRIGAILGKDLREAVRDGRILVLLLLPLGLALFYASTTSDRDERPQTTVVVVDRAGIGLADELREAAARSVEVTMLDAGDAGAARRIVDADRAAFAVVSRGGVSEDGRARAEVLLPANASPTAYSVVALVDDAVAAAAGRPAASELRVQRLPVAPSDQRPTDLIDERTVLVGVCVIMLLTFVALVVVPIQTAEEIGTGTFGALRLAATGPEILAAKTLSGLLYALAGTVLMIVLTGVEVHDPVRLYGGASALALSLVGFGLLLGLVSGNANQINTYGGFLVLPVVILASAVLIFDAGVLAGLLDALPFSQGAQLLFDGVSPAEPFATGAVAWLVLAAWSLVGFAVLARIASRREA